MKVTCPVCKEEGYCSGNITDVICTCGNCWQPTKQDDTLQIFHRRQVLEDLPVDGFNQIKRDVALVVARVYILRISGFTCVLDTDINPSTLHYTGSCDGCPIIEAEKMQALSTGILCPFERVILPNKQESHTVEQPTTKY